jgi:hypothetical protein
MAGAQLLEAFLHGRESREKGRGQRGRKKDGGGIVASIGIFRR